MPKAAKRDAATAELDFAAAEPQHIPVGDNDIGGELLPILSKGLYTNPLDCIREYVQNGVDAGAKEIRIKVTGNSVVIFDNGSGMNMENLIEARKFGVSPKSPDEFAGFRGIGIYSGYDLSNRLIMRTKKEDEDKACVMRFDFAGMKQELERVRKERGGNQIPLNKLLTDYTSFNTEDWDDKDAHFTIVQLEDISDVHISRLSNRTQLRRYILQNLPVDFDDKFAYKTEIKKQLTSNVPNFKAVKIVLQSDDATDEVVAKPNIHNLQHPTFGFIKTSDKQNVAYFWACLNNHRGRIDNDHNSGVENDGKGKRSNDKKPVPDLSEYQGFVYKSKGFTIGDRQKLRPYFTAGSGTLYHWYTGEIYVLDSDVIPNAERDDFETSPAKTSLEAAVVEKLQELAKSAGKFQQEGVANEKIDKFISDFSNLQSNLERRTVDLSSALVELDTIIKEVRKQKPKASVEKKEAAEELLTNADKLHKRIRHIIDRASTTARKGRTQTTTTTKQTRTTNSSGAKTETTDEKRSLAGVIQELDWSSIEDYKLTVEIIDSVLTDVLGQSSQQYKMIVDEVEERLQAEIAE